MTSTTPEHDISTETQEMTDAEAIETLVRTDEEHLTETLNPIDDPAFEVPPTPLQVTVDENGETAEGIKVQRTQGTSPQMFHVLSEIGDGVFVAWDFCRRDGKPISQCTCKQGPEEPKYVTQWRLEHLASRKREFEKTMAEVTKKAKKDLEALITNKLDERAAAEQTSVTTTVDRGDAAPATSEEETA